jgi:hypothetical protein
MPGIAGPSAGEGSKRLVTTKHIISSRVSGASDGEQEPSSDAQSQNRVVSSFSIGQIFLAFVVAMIASAVVHATLFTDERPGHVLQANAHGEAPPSTQIQKLFRIYEWKLRTAYRRMSTLWTAENASEQNACSGIQRKADCLKVAGNDFGFQIIAVV